MVGVRDTAAEVHFLRRGAGSMLIDGWWVFEGRIILVDFTASAVCHYFSFTFVRQNNVAGFFAPIETLGGACFSVHGGFQLEVLVDILSLGWVFLGKLSFRCLYICISEKAGTV